MSEQIYSISGIPRAAEITRAAEYAADECFGPQVNPHIVGSAEYELWLRAYYSRVHELAIGVAA